MKRPSKKALEMLAVTQEGFELAAEALRTLKKLREQSADGLEADQGEAATGLLNISVAQAEAMEGLLEELGYAYFVPLDD